MAEYDDVFRRLDKLKRTYTALYGEVCKLRTKNYKLRTENGNLKAEMRRFVSDPEIAKLLKKYRTEEEEFLANYQGPWSEEDPKQVRDNSPQVAEETEEDKGQLREGQDTLRN